MRKQKNPLQFNWKILFTSTKIHVLEALNL